MNSASPCSLAGRYDNPIPPRFLAHIDFLKIPAQPCVCHYTSSVSSIKKITEEESDLGVFIKHLETNQLGNRVVARGRGRRCHISYICTYDLNGPVRNVFVACLLARCHFTGPKNSQFPGPNPLPLAQVMDLQA